MYANGPNATPGGGQMMPGMPMSDQKEDSSYDLGKQGILSLNNLTYRMQPDLSVAVSRTTTSQFFQSTTYAPTRTMVSIWNTGSAFVNAAQSSLVLDVTNTSFVPVYFGPSVFGCSAANLINRVTISSRSGSILEKIDRASQLSAIRVLYEHDRGWREFGPGTAAGTSNTLAALDWQPNTTLRFCIPLGVISPLLGSIDTLLPAQLCSGLKFELVLSSAEEALVSGGATDVLSYEIANARFETESYMLSDIVLRSLNSTSASAGLEIVGTTAFNSISIRSTSALNLECGKSASRALAIMLKERQAYATGARPSNVSFFKAASLDAASYISEFQTRTGSLYYPQASIRGIGPRQTSPELYAQTLRSVSKWHQTMGVSAGVSESEFRQGSAAFGLDLERSNVQQLSGIPLSNSRVLTVNAQWSSAPVGSTDIDLFLYYVTLIRVFGNSVIIEI
jgi:hypothetical protein